MRIGLVIYGQLDFPSGGFLYDKYLANALENAGHELLLFRQEWKTFPATVSQNWDADLREAILGANLDLLLEDELNHASLFHMNKGLKEKGGFPIVGIVHHLGMDEGERRWPLQAWIEKEYLRGVDAFLVNSATTQSAIGRWVSAEIPIQVAQPGGDRFGGISQATKIVERAKAKGPLKLLFLGAVSRRKQAHLLIEALASIRNASVELTLAGDLHVDPRYVAKINEMIERRKLADKAALLGHVEEDELKNLLSTSHVMILPSSYEGFGIAYLEAMAYGLPVVGMDRGGARQIIEHGKSGFLLQNNDVGELTRLLAMLAEDHGRVAEMGVAARKRFETFPTWKESMQKAAQFITHLPGNGKVRDESS